MVSQQGKYAVNWRAAFASMQSMLIDRYVESIYGKHQVRVLRILRQKGFTEEKELTKLSLLPQKNLRVILTRFINDGLVQIQEKPQSLKSNSSGPLYALSFGGAGPIIQFRQRVAQSILNHLIKS